MASFAKLSLGSKVISVHSLHNDVLKDANGVEQEILGINFLHQLHNYPFWKQTSYNTRGGVHLLGGTPFRKNHAGIGHIYDEDRDAFIEPKPYPSWTLNEDTCQWEAPSAYPDDGKRYNWNEETTSWKEVT